MANPAEAGQDVPGDDVALAGPGRRSTRIIAWSLAPLELGQSSTPVRAAGTAQQGENAVMPHNQLVVGQWIAVTQLAAITGKQGR